MFKKKRSLNNPDSAHDQRAQTCTDSAGRVAGISEWICPDCGRINQNYVGTCGCGYSKHTGKSSKDSTPENKQSSIFVNTISEADAVDLADDKMLPLYLRYPDDNIPNEKWMHNQRNSKCNYRIKVYSTDDNIKCDTRHSGSSFPIDEAQVYYSMSEPHFVTVKTLKTPMVLTSNLKNAVEGPIGLGKMFGAEAMIPFLLIPSSKNIYRYQMLMFDYMGETKKYNQLHGFDESHVYCHVCQLNDTIYKIFVLAARRNDYSWVVQCAIPSNNIKVTPQDCIPAGETFGSFYPDNNT